MYFEFYFAEKIYMHYVLSTTDDFFDERQSTLASRLFIMRASSISKRMPVSYTHLELFLTLRIHVISGKMCFKINKCWRVTQGCSEVNNRRSGDSAPVCNLILLPGKDNKQDGRAYAHEQNHLPICKTLHDDTTWSYKRTACCASKNLISWQL